MILIVLKGHKIINKSIISCVCQSFLETMIDDYGDIVKLLKPSRLTHTIRLTDRVRNDLNSVEGS